MMDGDGGGLRRSSVMGLSVFGEKPRSFLWVLERKNLPQLPFKPMSQAMLRHIRELWNPGLVLNSGFLEGHSWSKVCANCLTHNPWLVRFSATPGPGGCHMSTIESSHPSGANELRRAKRVEGQGAVQLLSPFGRCAVSLVSYVHPHIRTRGTVESLE